MIYLTSGFTLIAAGLFCDRRGFLNHVQILAAVFSICGNLLWSVSDKYYVSLPIAFMGIAYGLTAGSVINSVAHVVSCELYGSVISMFDCLTNFGLIVVPVLFGRLRDLD